MQREVKHRPGPHAVDEVVTQRSALCCSAPSTTRRLAAKVHVDVGVLGTCLLYTSDAADDLLCVDLGGRRIIKKKHIERRRSRF